jgi:hypothetical protein
MSHTIQAAMTFTIAFVFIVFLIIAGPVFYEYTNRAAYIFYCSKVNQHTNSDIYREDTIVFDQREADVVYTSPERMQYFIDAVSDSLSLIFEGVR